MEKINWKLVGIALVAGVAFWYFFMRTKPAASAKTPTDASPVTLTE